MVQAYYALSVIYLPLCHPARLSDLSVVLHVDFSVGIMWPGTFSMASVSIKRGGTAMFALMALAGDLGCAGGPTVVGMVSGHFADNLQMGTLAAIVFPVILCVGLAYTKKVRNV